MKVGTSKEERAEQESKTIKGKRLTDKGGKELSSIMIKEKTKIKEEQEEWIAEENKLAGRIQKVTITHIRKKSLCIFKIF